jgi:hypothetical protein
VSRRLSKWRAPSWSWASVDGGVEYSWVQRIEDTQRADYVTSTRSEMFVENLKANVLLVNEEDPTGQIRDGRLQPRGPLVKGTLSYRNSHTVETQSDDFMVDSNVAGGSVEIFRPDYTLSDESDPSHYVPDGTEVALLRTCQIGAEQRVLSLVLVLVGAERNVLEYRRIGIAEERSLFGRGRQGALRDLTIV